MKKAGFLDGKMLSDLEQGPGWAGRPRADLKASQMERSPNPGTPKQTLRDLAVEQRHSLIALSNLESGGRRRRKGRVGEMGR